jgi:hypothetical protein
LTDNGKFPQPDFFGSAVEAEQQFLIIDDHPLYLEALRTVLLVSFAGCMADVAGSTEAARGRLQRGHAVPASASPDIRHAPDRWHVHAETGRRLLLEPVS